MLNQSLRYGFNPGDYDDGTIKIGEPKPEVDGGIQFIGILPIMYIPEDIRETKRMLTKREHQIW